MQQYTVAHLTARCGLQHEPWLVDLGAYLQARGAGSPEVVADIIDRCEPLQRKGREACHRPLGSLYSPGSLAMGC